MRRPENIRYWLDEHPPAQISLLLAIQQLSFLGVYLVVSPIFARNLQLDHDQSIQLIASTLLASAFGVLLQRMQRFGIGSGYFCPLQATSSTFGALVLAKSLGSIATMFGAVTVVGVSQIVFAQIFLRLRSIFTIQIAGIAVMLIGLGLGHSGLKLIIQPEAGQFASNNDLLISMLTLSSMILCNVWSSGLLKLFSAFIGLLTGIVSSIYLGVISADEWDLVAAAPLFMPPEPLHLGWDFNWHTVLPGVVTGLFLALHGFGALIAAQRFSDADWKRPEMPLIRQGIVAEGITNLFASLMNGLPITSSGGGVTLAATTGCTSRSLAYWLAAIMTIIAFMPKVIVFLEILPPSVMGAAMMFLACFTAMTGLQIVSSRLLDSRKIITIGFGMMVGISFEPLRDLIYHHIPESMQHFIFSGVGFGVFVAVALSAIFRIGDHTRLRRRFDAHHSSIDDVSSFLIDQGKAWGARPEIVRKAEYATWQAFEILTEHDLLKTFPDGKQAEIELETVFNEFTFSVLIRYRGQSVPLAMHPPTHEEFLLNEDGVLQMAGYLLRRLADSVSIRDTSEGCILKLVFSD